MIVNVFCEGDDVFDQNDNAVRALYYRFLDSWDFFLLGDGGLQGAGY